MRDHIYIFLILTLLSVAGFSQGKAETTGAASDVSPQMQQALEPKGYKLTTESGTAVGEIWLAKQVATQDAKAGGDVAYPQLATSTLVGVIKLAGATKDFRGQTIKAGTYSLRYAVMPSDANHLGAAPQPDFLLLVAAADDVDAAKTYSFQQLVKMSARAAGTNHPAGLEMMPGDTKDPQARVWQNADGYDIFSAALSTKNGKLAFSVIVKGVAPQ